MHYLHQHGRHHSKYASHTLVRELAIMRTRVIAAALLHAYENETSEYKQLCHQVNQEWLTEVEKCASDPSHGGSVDAHTLTAQEASYLTTISTGNELFIFVPDAQLPLLWS